MNIVGMLSICYRLAIDLLSACYPLRRVVSQSIQMVGINRRTDRNVRSTKIL